MANKTAQSGALSNTTFVRALGGVEHTFAWMNARGVQLPMALGQVDGQIPLRSFQRAVAWLHERHQPLRHRILPGKTPKAPLEFHEGAPCPVALHTTEELSDYPQIAHEQLHTPFDPESGPLWRPILVHHADAPELSTVAIVMHHAIEDGTTVKNLFHELLTCVRTLEAGQPLAPPDKVETIPSVEDLNPYKLSVGETLHGFWNFFWELFKPPRLILDQDNVPLDERSTHAIVRYLSAETTQALLGRCRAEGTSLHGALAAAMLHEAAPFTKREGAIYLQCESSVDLRSDCVPPVEAHRVGPYFSALTDRYRVAPDTAYWDTARDVRTRITSKLEAKLHAKYAKLVGILNEKTLHNVIHSKHARLQCLYVSNLGRFGFGEDKQVQFALNTFFGCNGIHGCGACLWTCATTVKGRLNLIFMYPHPIVHDETASALVDNIIERLQQAAGGGLLTSERA